MKQKILIMRKTTFCFFLFTFFSIFNLVCQNIQPAEKIQEDLSSYFELPRESIFVHLNKTTYIQGENIWFKGYIYDRKANQPFAATTNVYLGVYDNKGKQISRKLYLAKNGYLQGNIEIDSTFNTGNHYIKASTSWMQNFKEDDSFVQKIEIIDNSSFKTTKILPQFDVQFLPEGGNLITNILNTIGVKALNQNGYGIEILKGQILDRSNEPVANFSTNKYGLGKFNFTPKTNEAYKAKVTFKNGHELIYPLPIAKNEGISLQLKNNSLQEKIALVVNTNNFTLNKVKQQQFYLVVHSDGISNLFDFSFKDKNSISFFLDKKNLKKGVNTITVLNEEGIPLTERLFFNSHDFTVPEIRVAQTRVEKDSITIGLEIPKNKSITNNLSISVLPKGTISYNPQNTILSQFYLKPYITGFIENPGYYFKNFTPTKEHDLDLLLLTQGWSRYEWKDIQNNTPKIIHEFERGLNLKGYLNGKESKNFGPKELLFHSTANHNWQKIEIPDNENKFSVSNLYVNKDETLYFSLLKGKGELVKPQMYLTVLSNIKEDKVDKLYKNKISEKPLALTNVNFNDFIIDSKTIELYEVELEGEKKEEKKLKNISVPKYIESDLKPVDVNLALTYPRILDLIRSKGYNVREGIQAFQGGTPSSSFSRVSITSRRQSFLSGGSPVAVYFDGAYQPNLDFLLNIQTADIESYFFDKLGRYAGASANGAEIIYIFSRMGERLSLNGKPIDHRTFELNSKIGFEKEKEFYSPRYLTFFDDSFAMFGIIHWSPQVVTDNEGKASFKLFNTGLKDFDLYIEGMGADGTLYSSVKEIRLE